jgi:hypothetical protein
MRICLRQPLLALLGAALLALAFAGYLRPAFVIDVANRVWLCF